VSEVGTVICSLFKSSSEPTSTFEVIARSANMVYGHHRGAGTAGGLSHTLFRNVEPATEYFMYCASKSVYSLLYSGFGDIIKERTYVKSAGNKDLVVRLLDSTFLESATEVQAITVKLTAPPLTFLNVSITASSGGDNTTLQFYSLQSGLLDQSSWSALQTFVFQPNITGHYWINVSLTGSGSEVFNVTYSNGNYFAVLERHTVPPQPMLDSVTFTEDGLSLVASFSKKTDMAGRVLSRPFLCSELFEFISSSTTKCYWKDAATVVIVLNDESIVIAVGDTVTLRGGLLRGECKGTTVDKSSCLTWSTLHETSTAVLPPLIPQVPKVFISAPSFVNALHNLSLDISSSSGAVGKPWKSLSIAVSSTNASSQNVLQDYLTGVNDTSWFPLAISSDLIDANSTYDFVVDLCNAFDECSTGVHSVTVSSFLIPAVRIQGPQVVTVSTHSSLFLQSLVSFEAVYSPVQFEDISFVWCVNANERRDSSIVSMSRSSANFLVPAYTLTPGTVYEVILTASYLNMSSYFKTVVIVNEATLVAIIAGPVTRSVRLGGSVEIDASGSYFDFNNPATVHDSESTRFQYVWDCAIIEPFFHPSCDEFVTSFGDGWHRKQSLSSNVNSTHMVGYELRVSVTVIDTTLHKHGHASVTIIVAPVASPDILVSSPYINNVINPSDTMKLQGLVQVYQQFHQEQFTWELDEDGIDLQNIALTSVSKSFSHGGAFNMNLVIRANSLEHRDAPYVFTLSSTAQDGSVTTGSVAIRINQPPILGSFIVTPSSGLAFETSFAFASTDWEDIDLPFSFSFGYIGQTELPNFLKRQKKLSVIKSILPQGTGIGMNLHNLRCVNYVHDFLGARTINYFDAKVVVKPPSNESQVSLLNSTNSLFEATAGDVDATQAVILLTSSTVNFVNCSLSPNCAELSRLECSKIEHTCGECINGTSGDSGDHNTTCLNDNDFDDYLANADTSRSCLTDSDCHAWEECVADGVSPLCQRALKTCQDDCNMQGDCVFQHVSSGVNLSTCVVGDTSCTAKCICEQEFTGDQCSISIEDAQLVRNVTLLLLQKTEETLNSEEHDTDSIVNMLVVLESVLQSPYLLTRESISLSFDILNDVFILILDGISVSTEELSRVSKIFDILLKGLSEQLLNSEEMSCPDSLVDVFLDRFAQFESIISGNLIAGQFPFIVITELLRSTTQSQDLELENVSLSVPLTALEANVNIKPSEIQSKNIFPETVFSFASKLYGECGADFTSNPTKFVLDSGFYSNNNDDDGEVFQLKSELVNNLPVDYPIQPADKEFTTECVTGDIAVHTYTCPIVVPQPSPYALISNMTVTHQCTGAAEVLRTVCPVVILQSQCVVIDAALGISCEQSQFTNGYTACVCRNSNNANVSTSRRLSTTKSRRRQLQGTDDSFMLVTAPLVVVEEAVISTADIVYSPKDITSTASLSFILVCVIFCALCLVFSIRSKRRKILDCSNDETNDKTDATKDVIPAEKIEDSLITLLRKPSQSSLRMEARKELFTYLKRIIPYLFQTRASFYRRIYIEFYRNHRYLRPQVIHDEHTFKSRDEMQSILFVGQFLVVQAIVFLCLVLLHVRQYPDDDGECSKQLSLGECEEKHSFLDEDQEICKWQPRSITAVTDYFPCKYILPVVSFHSVFLFSSVAAVLSAVLNFFVDILANNVLLCEDSDEEDRKRKSHVVSVEELSAPPTSGPSARQEATDVDAISVMESQRNDGEGNEERLVKKGKLTYVAKDGHVRAAHRAVVAVKRVWSDSSNMVDNGFCDKMFVPELLMLNAGMIRLALNSLNVSSSVIANGNEMNNFFELVYCIKQQRRVITEDINALRSFDRYWGLEENSGQFISNQKGVTCGDETVYFKNDRVDQLLHQEHVAVTSIAETEIEQLSFLRQDSDGATFEAIAGIRILHVFLMDLIGRRNAASVVFGAKIEQELIIKKKVPHLFKILAWMFIVITGIVCVVLSIVYSIDKTYYWQITLIVNYVCALLIEVFIYESCRCFLHHCFLPYFLFRDEVKNAVEKLLSITVHLCAEEHHANANGLNILDSPKYMHVSSSVATEFPQLIESAIVLSYHATSPGPCALYWEHLLPMPPLNSMSENISMWHRRIGKKFVNMFYNTIPLSCQSVMIHSILPLLIAILLQCSANVAAKIMIGLTFGPILALSGLLYFWYNGSALWKSCKSSVAILIAKGKVSPLPQSHGSRQSPKVKSGGTGTGTGGVSDDPVDMFIQRRDHKRNIMNSSAEVSEYLNVSPKKYALPDESTSTNRPVPLSPPPIPSNIEGNNDGRWDLKTPSKSKVDDSYFSAKVSVEGQSQSFAAALESMQDSGFSPRIDGNNERRLVKSAGGGGRRGHSGSAGGNGFRPYQSIDGMRPLHSSGGFRPNHSSEGYRPTRSSGGDYRPGLGTTEGRFLHSTGGSRAHREVRPHDSGMSGDHFPPEAHGALQSKKVKRISRYEQKKNEERAAMLSPTKVSVNKHLDYSDYGSP